MDVGQVKEVRDRLDAVRVWAGYAVSGRCTDREAIEIMDLLVLAATEHLERLRRSWQEPDPTRSRAVGGAI
jgi:hypothetical protein